jgi:hypothetical protein
VKIIKAIYDKERPQIVLFGKQSIDGDNSRLGRYRCARRARPGTLHQGHVVTARCR